MEEWYYTREGKQQGPVHLETLRDMAAKGELKPEDMVWNGSMADWVPSREVEGIHTGATAAPSLAPGTVGPPPLSKNWADDPDLQEIEPGSDPIDIGKIFKHTLELTKRHFQVLILTGLIVFGASMALSFVQQIVSSVGGALVDAPPPPQPNFENVKSIEDFMEQMGPAYSMKAMAPALILIIVVFQIVSSLINLYLSLGMTRICLNLVEGKEATVPMLFGEAGKLLRAIGASIISFIIVFIGLLFLIFPGIYLAIRLSAVIPSIVDRNMGVMDAIHYSFKITKGNCAMLFLLWLAAVFLMIVAIVITCGMGAIIVGPVFTLGWILTYRWMQYGRRVAE